MNNLLSIASMPALQLLAGFAVNALVITILVRYLYYPAARSKEFLFTFVSVGFTVFLLCFVLESVKLELGLALGLFAIFGILRYRTASMPIKEITYLFVVISVSVINALTLSHISYTELFMINVLLVLSVWMAEKTWCLKSEICMCIDYDKIDLIRPEFAAQLKSDLEKRIGRSISKIQIANADFKKQNVELKVFYYEEKKEGVHQYSRNEMHRVEMAEAMN